jgi:chaperonin cofactor prefoldin
VLTKAIQELKAINDAQATRIETLEAQNAAFEARLAALEAK